MALKHLLLAGTGPAHVRVLQSLARSRGAEVNVTVVAAQPSLVMPQRVAGFVAGRHGADEAMVDLQPLVQASGARFVAGHCTALDAAARVLRVDAREAGALEVPFDVLGIDTEPSADRAGVERAIPGALRNALFVHPLDAFLKLWPQLATLADGKPMSIALVGNGAFAAELAFAMQRRLPGSRVTWVTQGAEPAHDAPAGLAPRLLALLRARNITLLKESCVGVEPGQLLLGSGARLACDAPVIALAAPAPGWVAASGLALDEGGRPLIDVHGQSVSHAGVFASADGGIAAGTALDASLRSALAGQAPVARLPVPRPGLHLLSCADARAVLSWNSGSAEGRWAGWWRESRDRKRAARLRAAGG